MPERSEPWTRWATIKKALPDFLKARRQEELQKEKKEVVRRTTGNPAQTKDDNPAIQNKETLREKMRKSLKI